MKDIEAFKTTEVLPFKMKDERERLEQIQQSIMSIERNLKAHLNTFENVSSVRKNVHDNVRSIVKGKLPSADEGIDGPS